MRPINKRGPRVLGGLPLLKPLAPEEVRGLAESGAAVLDLRKRGAFFEAHIPGAYGIPLARSLGVWAGWLIPFAAPLVLVADSAADRLEAVRQLIRVGYDDFRGYLEGGLEAWANADLPVASVKTMRVAELREMLNSGGEPPVVLDVRHNNEWMAGHIPGAKHIENGRLPYIDLPLPKDRPIAVHCAASFRSTAAVSVLLRRGYHDLIAVQGGFDEWRAAGFEIAHGD
jgi:hydroxyacylglutathione hydrolase